MGLHLCVDLLNTPPGCSSATCKQQNQQMGTTTTHDAASAQWATDCTAPTTTIRHDQTKRFNQSYMVICFYCLLFLLPTNIICCIVQAQAILYATKRGRIRKSSIELTEADQKVVPTEKYQKYQKWNRRMTKKCASSKHATTRSLA